MNRMIEDIKNNIRNLSDMFLKYYPTGKSPIIYAYYVEYIRDMMIRLDHVVNPESVTADVIAEYAKPKSFDRVTKLLQINITVRELTDSLYNVQTHWCSRIAELIRDAKTLPIACSLVAQMHQVTAYIAERAVLFDELMSSGNFEAMSGVHLRDNMLLPDSFPPLPPPAKAATGGITMDLVKRLEAADAAIRAATESAAYISKAGIPAMARAGSSIDVDAIEF